MFVKKQEFYFGVCFFLSFMIASSAFASSSSLSGVQLKMGVIGYSPFGKPIRVYVHGKVREKTDALLHVTPPDGMRFLQGEQFVNGKWNGTQMVCMEEYSIEIERPGRYALTAFFHATGMKDSYARSKLPRYDTLFFYATNDTIAVFRTSEVMERRIQDSLIIPQEKIKARRHQKFKAEQKSKQPTFLQSGN